MDRLTPHIFWRHGESFLQAATAVVDPECHSDKPFKRFGGVNIVAYYLVGHSIELTLKSFLYAKKYSVRELRNKFGHDLLGLLKECRKRKLGREVKLTKVEMDAVELLNDTYKSKKFEYLEYGSYRFPEYHYIHGIAIKLSNGLARYAMPPPASRSRRRRKKVGSN